MKTYKKGSEVHEQFEKDHLIYFIKKGHVKIGIKQGDQFAIRYSLGKGNIFGESKVTTGEEGLPYSAIAMSDCTICFIETTRMEELMQQYPRLHNSILKIAGLKFRRIERRLEDVLFKDANARIKDFLFDFVQEHGAHEEDDMIAANIFTHSEIAKLTTSRQTVNNVISQLRKTDGFYYDRKLIKVKSSGIVNKSQV